MEHILDSKTMQSMEALARTNMAISEAKVSLDKLKQSETEYLQTRETLAIEKINKVLKESQDLLTETQNNYYEVTQFYNTVSSVAEFVSEIQTKFEGLLEDFIMRSDLWEKEQAKQEQQIADMREEVNRDRIRLETDKKSIETQKRALDKEKIVIQSRQEQIKVALAILNKKQNG